ncbi:polysaccharide deacetylase family protein [Candidatus Woesearchaeota archaeon]|nr:polysaccharide deacetylase family protein [Candidatus Woesearchaeota archaeon]
MNETLYYVKELAKSTTLALILTAYTFVENPITKSKPEKKPKQITREKTIYENPSKIKIQERLNKLINEEYYKETKKNIETKKIPVLMFHKIGYDKDRYTITPKEFENILTQLKNNNYYILEPQNFIQGNLSKVPIGKKPAVLTFDDATEGQFKLLPNNKPNPTTAIGILENYTHKNKNFGKGAIFFISFHDGKNQRYPFNERNKVKQKLEYLLQNEYLIGSHTPDHTMNQNATKQDVEEQTTRMKALLQYFTNTNIEDKITTYAHPGGAIPKNKEAQKQLNDTYQQIFEAWGGLTIHPLSAKYDPKKITRIETNPTTIETHILNQKNQYIMTIKDKQFYQEIFKPVIKKQIILAEQIKIKPIQNEKTTNQYSNTTKQNKFPYTKPKSMREINWESIQYHKKQEKIKPN